MRRSSGAIAVAIVLFVTPILFSTALPLNVAQWLVRITPVAGFSITQTLPVDLETAVEPWSMAGPWAGLGVLGIYAVVALMAAHVQLRRRDA
jgi:ABC-type transport system involved in multi-copper enzyme maturation permease subunit